MKIIVLIIFVLSVCCHSFPQTIGGRTVYNFLKLPSSPMLTAAGGINISYNTNEVGLAANNPALLSKDVSKQLNTSFNAFLGGIKAYSLTGALTSEKLNATFGSHVYFIDYGAIPNADAAGNVGGEFHPVDFVIQASAAKNYLEKWTYGATVKFINSSYQQYTSNAVALDVGVLFYDSAKKFAASFLAKNMGVQLKAYAGEKEDLPFDVEAGITKRLSKAPFGFSFTAHHLHRFNLRYNDTTFNQDNDLSSSSSAFVNLFNHLVLATHVYVGQNLEATLGYNFLRRRELSEGIEGSGLTGFSAGLLMQFSKLQILYALSNYQRNVLYNQIGLTLNMDKLFGL